MRRTIIYIMIFVVFTAVNLGAVPTTINFQGALRDADNQPVTATKTIEFLIYPDSTGIIELWSETHSSVEISDGIFSAELGSVNPFPSDLFANNTLYLTFQIDGDEMTPRQKLLSVPYAKIAEKASSIDGSFDSIYVNKTGPDTITANSTEGALNLENTNSSGKGLKIIDAGDGVFVNSAGNPSTQNTSSSSNGVEVAGAQGNGVYVGHAGQNGIYVEATLDDGIHINSADGEGVFISTTGSDGVFVWSAGSPSTSTISADKNGLEIAGAEGNGVFVGRADKHGLQVNKALNDGINIYEAGSPTQAETSDWKNGFEAAGTQGAGLFVGRADKDGVRVLSSGYNGFYIKSTHDNGFHVRNAGDHGLYAENVDVNGVRVDSAGADGINIQKAGSPSTQYTSSTHNGVEIAGAEGHGIFVGQADKRGVHIGNSAESGLYVNSAGKDGVNIQQAGSPSNQITSSSNNGVEIAGAEGNGIYIGQADMDGVYVDNSDGAGFYVDHADFGVKIGHAGTGVIVDHANVSAFNAQDAFYGLYVDSTYFDGVWVRSTGDDGVYVSSAGGDGVDANTTDPLDEWGIYTPDKIHGSNISTRTQSVHVYNSGSQMLEPGDLVSIAGGYRENVLGDDDNEPLINVKKANSNNSEAVLGVVEYKVRIREEVQELENGETRIDKSFRFAPGDAMPGDYLSVIILGPADVKVDTNTDIKIGEPVVVTNNGVRKRKTTRVNGIKLTENTGIVGKALENSQSSDKLKVFVNCK